MFFSTKQRQGLAMHFGARRQCGCGFSQRVLNMVPRVSLGCDWWRMIRDLNPV